MGNITETSAETFTFSWRTNLCSKLKNPFARTEKQDRRTEEIDFRHKFCQSSVENTIFSRRIKEQCDSSKANWRRRSSSPSFVVQDWRAEEDDFLQRFLGKLLFHQIFFWKLKENASQINLLHILKL